MYIKIFKFFDVILLANQSSFFPAAIQVTNKSPFSITLITLLPLLPSSGLKNWCVA